MKAVYEILFVLVVLAVALIFSVCTPAEAQAECRQLKIDNAETDFRQDAGYCLAAMNGGRYECRYNRVTERTVCISATQPNVVLDWVGKRAQLYVETDVGMEVAGIVYQVQPNQFGIKWANEDLDACVVAPGAVMWCE